MIHPDEARTIVRSFFKDPGLETLGLESLLGRVMPRSLSGRIDQPPFDKAAMDGWAWHPSTDNGNPAGPGPGGALAIRGVIAAGSDSIDGARPDEPLGPGEAVRIMTGAPLPEGASKVHRVEWAETVDSAGKADPEGCFVRFVRPESCDNVIKRGENSRAGQEILSPRLLSAQDIGILAADGRAEARVSAKVVVGVLSTGTELASPGASLSGASIYDSNKAQILAQLALPAFETRDLGRLDDDYQATLASVRSALDSCDVLVLSGGVSMGDFDFVPRALAAAGVSERFHGVAMKPGKPTFFGTGSRAFVFGLPGNPVSVFVNTEFLVKELLFALAGIHYKPREIPVLVAEDIWRKGSDRVEFLPVRVDPDGLRAVPYGGSSGLQALADADGFVRLEIGQSSIEKGTQSRVRFVR